MLIVKYLAKPAPLTPTASRRRLAHLACLFKNFPTPSRAVEMVPNCASHRDLGCPSPGWGNPDQAKKVIGSRVCLEQLQPAPWRLRERKTGSLDQPPVRCGEPWLPRFGTKGASKLLSLPLPTRAAGEGDGAPVWARSRCAAVLENETTHRFRRSGFYGRRCERNYQIISY